MYNMKLNIQTVLLWWCKEILVQIHSCALGHTPGDMLSAFETIKIQYKRNRYISYIE